MEVKAYQQSWDSFLEAYQELLDDRAKAVGALCVALDTLEANGLDDEVKKIKELIEHGESISDSISGDETNSGDNEETGVHPV